MHTLRLDRNSIGDEGLQSITPPLSKHEKLCHFSAATNDITQFGGNLLVSLLMSRKDLRTLRIAGNRLEEIGRHIVDYLRNIRHFRQCSVYCHFDLKRRYEFSLLDLTT